ncbi:hypothetical protein [Hydrogenovibrio kuenenii]|uniref:hypothetical protein n=1 Tax=Hydrogenovibrio kuenenii TaxID=63658 RepID=UPI000464E88E|nr:hypothetical protein [Hydrogenovibrio kuenenii]
MKQKPLIKHIHAVLAGSAIGLASFSSPTVMAGEFTDALTGGKPTVDIRLRYEGVNQKGKDDAAAFTERTRVGYLTGDYKGFTGFVEMSGTEALGGRKNYYVAAGPGAGGDATKAVVLDPTITVLNQAWIGYKVGSTAIKAGKQRIIFDTRFLGNVGWRQTEQVYTGVTLKTAIIPKTMLDYAYITDTRNPIGVDRIMKTHALQAAYGGIPFGKLTAYAYLIDYDLNTLGAAEKDSQTTGLRFAGKTGISDSMKAIYHIEYATQGKYADSTNIGGDYTRAELGLGFKKAAVKIGQEKLGGNGTHAFQTPLGTVHLYNGWADMFIGPVGGTPANGLIDNYLNVSGKALGMKLAAAYHDFSADKGGSKYGTEYDLLAAKKFGKVYTAGVKYASFSADSASTYKNTNKIWIWGEAKF